MNTLRSYIADLFERLAAWVRPQDGGPRPVKPR